MSRWAASAIVLAAQLALSGPDVVRQGETATFTASGVESATYAFDLDGDGRFEVDTGPSATVTARFDTAGRFNIGVRAIDGQGARSYADRLLEVQAPPVKQLVAQFSADRPVFGGRRARPLTVRYRLREAATVTVDLRRGGKRVERLVNAVARAAEQRYTLRISARGRRRGAYAVQLQARTPAGRTQSARIVAERL